MPFKSQAQWKLFSEKLHEGKIDQATFDEWVNASPSFHSLPEKLAAPPPAPRKKRKSR